MKVQKWDSNTDGPLSESALRNKLESIGYHCTRYIYPPRTVFPEHSHEVDKIDAVLSGKFKLSMKDKNVILEAGDYLFVPKGMIHRAEVIGNESVVSIDAIKNP
ncbi:MAG: cupin domain-containing protein [Gammaproteobacteria bacterium]|nr:cupin domain-containing protein [Gammaproteobacteria bacterium]